MKKSILSILCFTLIIGITGCDKKKNIINDLNKVNNEIIEYFSACDVNDCENYIFNYVDEKNKIVIVGLENNSEEAQKKFKENVIDSDLIEFEQLEELPTSEEGLNELKNKIPSILQNKDYSNISSYLIDDKDHVVVIYLINNSKEAQKKFRQTIFNSRYILFKQDGVNSILM